MTHTSIFNNHSYESQNVESTISLYLSGTEVVYLVSLVSLLGSIGLLQNLVVIISVILTEGSLDAPGNIFVLSLACADLLVCGVSTPLLIYNFFHWIFTEFITVSKFIVVATSGSIFLLTLNRLLAIVEPLKYVKLMTTKRAVALVGIIWSVALLVAIASIFGLIYEIDEMTHITRYFLAFYIILSSSMYFYMHVVARRHRKRIALQMSIVTGQAQAIAHEFKALRTLAMVAGTAAMCWLPMTVGLFFTDRSTNPAQFHRVFSFTAPLVIGNAVLDPTIYYHRSKGFRFTLQMLAKCIKNRGYF